MNNYVRILLFAVWISLFGCGNITVHDPAGCSVEKQTGGSLISCTDGSNSFVADGTVGPQGVAGERGPAGKNGSDGHDDIDGVPGSTISFVDPCPTLVAAFPEIMALIDGKFYAVYSSGSSIHWSHIPPGSYQTTDGRACTFTVTAEGILDH